ncbi:DsbA family oxidoreductase [Simplicispira psychrophila]|uniref:DsbA family oxidoreductase n=1 Tax=Simplicispira psychrophila TaxID=80882 RepID=UPI000488FFF0|nr:DsbA family oxidoreductase [Simplicispira psychrophila]
MTTPHIPPTLRVDFVSDVSCPWCAVGLGALQAALANVAPGITAELHFQPFELNPHMSAEGQDTIEHLTQKYGISAEQARANGETIRQRGAAVGFTYDPERRSRVWNTFDAHRLLHWAELEGPAQQLALKQALLKAYLTDGKNPSDPVLLVQLAGAAGLSTDRAREILASDTYADATHAREQEFLDAGIHSVPAIILNRQHLISGGQPVQVFERALRQVAGEVPPAQETTA